MEPRVGIPRTPEPRVENLWAEVMPPPRCPESRSDSEKG
ncbi:uncharacterized LOC128092247 homolog isoform X1 [Aotus nancymaae]